MIANVTFVCDTPGCNSTCEIHPVDAKEGPEKALEDRGWKLIGQECDGTKTVSHCLCPWCAEKAKNVPVHPTE